MQKEFTGNAEIETTSEVTLCEFVYSLESIFARGDIDCKGIILPLIKLARLDLRTRKTRVERVSSV